MRLFIAGIKHLERSHHVVAIWHRELAPAAATATAGASTTALPLLRLLQQSARVRGAKHKTIDPTAGEKKSVVLQGGLAVRPHWITSSFLASLELIEAFRGVVRSARLQKERVIFWALLRGVVPRSPAWGAAAIATTTPKSRLEGVHTLLTDTQRANVLRKWTPIDACTDVLLKKLTVSLPFPARGVRGAKAISDSYTDDCSQMRLSNAKYSNTRILEPPDLAGSEGCRLIHQGASQSVYNGWYGEATSEQVQGTRGEHSMAAEPTAHWPTKTSFQSPSSSSVNGGRSFCSSFNTQRSPPRKNAASMLQ